MAQAALQPPRVPLLTVRQSRAASPLCLFSFDLIFEPPFLFMLDGP